MNPYIDYIKSLPLEKHYLICMSHFPEASIESITEGIQLFYDTISPEPVTIKPPYNISNLKLAIITKTRNNLQNFSRNKIINHRNFILNEARYNTLLSKYTYNQAVISMNGTGNNILMTASIPYFSSLAQEKVFKLFSGLKIKTKGNQIIFRKKMMKRFLATMTAKKIIERNTGGRAGFKGAKRRLPYAAHVTGSQLGVNIRKTFNKANISNIQLAIKGYDAGSKFSAVSGIKNGLGNSFSIDKISLLTKNNHNGCKRRKMRRK